MLPQGSGERLSYNVTKSSRVIYRGRRTHINAKEARLKVFNFFLDEVSSSRVDTSGSLTVRMVKSTGVVPPMGHFAVPGLPMAQELPKLLR